MNRLASIVATTAFAVNLAACGEPSPQVGNTAVEDAATPRLGAASQLAADMELSSKVKQVLQVPGGHVEVAASDGVVTLYGTVGAPAEKQRVALLAMNVEGVRSVVNNLVVVRGS